MLLYCLPKSKGNKWKYLRDWLETFMSARDAVWRAEDPLPFLGMLISTAYFVWLAFSKKIPAIAVTTYDIEWNGQ